MKERKNNLRVLERKFCKLFVVLLFFSCEKSMEWNENEKCQVPEVDFTELSFQSTFENPILPGGPDPWIVKHDSIYYYTYTQGSKLVILKTKNPSELASATRYEVWDPPSGMPYSQNIWAPELHRINEKWYFYFAADNGENANHRMYVLENSSDSPVEGNWEFKGKLTDQSDKWAIDGTVFNYNEELYTLWSGGNAGAPPQNIYIAKMDNPWTISSEKVLVSSPIYDWEKFGNPINEGPQVLLNPDGQVFVVYSASGFWVNNYCLGLLSLQINGDPLNSSHWSKKSEPIFSMNAEGNTYGPGHNGFFKSPNGEEDWIIYHARSGPDGGGRNPRIQRFSFNQDGIPEFGEPISTDVSLKKPAGETLRWIYLKDDWSIADFSSEETNNSRLAERLIDNDISTYWITRYSTDPTNYPNHWITVDMGGVNSIDGFTFAQKGDDRRIKDVEILISYDNESWESLGQFLLNDIGSLTQFIDLNERREFRYFKLVPVSGYGNQNQPGLAEIGVFRAN